jgi:hypothetical protein
MNCRIGVKHSFIFLAALTLGACLDEPESTDDLTTDGAESASLSLDITSPGNLSAMDTTDASMSLSGSASADLGVFEVSWVNDRGGEGVAAGTESWKIQNIDLELGENQVTVTAEDTSGATKSRRLRVKRESGENGSATLSWTPPTTRIDGSPLNNLAGYKIFYGRMSGVYDYEVEIDNPGVVTYVVEGLVSGDWYFTLAAFDTDGLQSDRSNEVLREIS